MIANDPVVCAVISSYFQQCGVGKTQCLSKKSLNKKLFTLRRQHPTHNASTYFHWWRSSRRDDIFVYSSLSTRLAIINTHVIDIDIATAYIYDTHNNISQWEKILSRSQWHFKQSSSCDDIKMSSSDSKSKLNLTFFSSQFNLNEMNFYEILSLFFTPSIIFRYKQIFYECVSMSFS